MFVREFVCESVYVCVWVRPCKCVWVLACLCIRVIFVCVCVCVFVVWEGEKEN